MKPQVEYDGIADRIQGVYSSCSNMEKQVLMSILQEMSISGESQTLEQLWLADFKEVPVSIEQFIADPIYLGQTNRNGEAVYPFWKQTLSDIFNNGNKYNEIILSGATRIGKTSTATIITAYMLYRLMLYRNPHEYFKKKQVSKFTIAFANLTKELAMGVAYREFNDTLKNSQWFNEHGRFSRSDRNFYYIPEGDKIEIVAGSDAAHLLGMQIWCLKGDTNILTADGVKTLEECQGKRQDIFQYSPEGELICTSAEIQHTNTVQDLIRIELEDGTLIEGTPEHRVMLSDGSYKELQYLTASENLICMASNNNTVCIKINNVEKIHYKEFLPVYDVINVRPYHNFVIVGQDSNLFVSHNCAVMDETNFAKAGVKDINIAKAHMKKLYDTINARISGTFRVKGEVYGKLVASSSKNTDSDFLSDHIETQLNAGNSHVYVVDRPQWEILPKSMFSEERFHFTVGDRYKRGFVIPEEEDDEEHRQEYINQGYQVIEAPAELRKNFVADYDIALRDIAGISVVGAMGFITQEMITPNISETRHNPFFTDIIYVGVQDSHSIEEYFRLEQVPSHLKRCPLNIHLDLSESGDRTGIDGVCVDGNKLVTDKDGRKVTSPFFREIFSVGVEAPRGDRLSFQKVVNFILWLRRNGFNVNTVSTDQYQSSFLRELLTAQGFRTSKISVDRSEDPYIGLRSILYEQRIELIRNEVRDDELIHLQRNNGKIDHPLTKSDGGKGSKDISDCLCGACWTHTTEHTKTQPSRKNVAKAINRVNGVSAINRNPMNGIFNTPKRY